MRQDERYSLRLRFQFCCGYCGVRESDVGAELTVDHFQPISQGGLDEPENWVYCCHACNEFKGDYWQPASALRVLHPIRGNLATHVHEDDDGVLVGNTETGVFHIDQLRLNRAQLALYRRERRLLQAALTAQADVLHRLQLLEQQVQDLTSQVERLERGDQTS